MIKNILLLEPFNTPFEIITKEQNIKNYKKALLTYAIGLVHKKFKLRITSLHSIPLGLAQISSIIKEEGAFTDHIPFILTSNKKYISDYEIEQKISSHDYDSVWMTVGSPEAAYEVIRYARIVKRINIDTPIMIGGILPSMYPEFFLKQPDIDFLIRGPAEVAVKQYIKDSSIENAKNIPGFCYKSDSGKINISPSNALEPNLNETPPYDFEGLCIDDYMKDNNFCNLQTSRGCPFNCPFCTHTEFWGQTAKFRSIENLKKEMNVLQEHGCKAGYLIDSTFTLNRSFLKKFVDVYEKQKITIKFMFETRADLFTSEIAEISARIKPYLVWFGAESGSLTVLKRLRGKDQGNGRNHIKNLFNAVEIAKRYNMICGSSWVIGLPGENRKTIEETRNFIFKLDKAGMDITDIRILQIFPGTSYWKEPEKWGLKMVQKEGIASQNIPSWEYYSGHDTEELTSKEIEMLANQLKEELHQHYLTKTKIKVKK